MRCVLPLLVLAPVCAQSVDDVGMFIDSPTPPLFFGQSCAPVSCQPLLGPSLGRGETRFLWHQSAPHTPYAIAIGLPGPCAPMTGVANALLLLPPVTQLAFSVTGAALSAPCNPGSGFFAFSVPRTAPLGLTVRFQSVGFSNAGVLAFGPAIETTVAR